jgi:putative ABC transport system permease protein
VLPGYFEALQTPIVAGRAFTDSDNVPSSTAVIIDESLARKAFPDISAVGQRLLIRIRTPEPEWVQIVGVAAHQRVTTLTRPGREQLFVTDGFLGHGSASRWAIRTAADVRGYARVLRAAFADMSQVVLTEVQPMESLVDRAQVPTRFSFVLIAVLGSSAMVLALVGIYGVMAGAVRQRTAEIGVRMALGADATSIRRLFLGQGTNLGVVGVLVGLAAALALTPRVESMLVGTEATDPVTFASVGVLFLLTALSASWLPARAAARLDPADALRSE